jgi:hypothetical protein
MPPTMPSRDRHLRATTSRAGTREPRPPESIPDATELREESEAAPPLLDAHAVLALQRRAGNAAVAKLLREGPARPASLHDCVRGAALHDAPRSIQRYVVDPMPRVEHQWFKDKSLRLIDLNCGWYAQLGAVDYHYLKSVQPLLTEDQRRRLEKRDHLSYSTGAAKLPYTTTYGFDPEGYDKYGRRYQEAPPAAISREIDKPADAAGWEAALKDYGPLIVGKARHYLLVVGVTPRAFHYRDSLTGTAMYHDFPLMQTMIEDVHYVSPLDVKRLFESELAQSAPVSRPVEGP